MNGNVAAGPPGGGAADTRSLLFRRVLPSLAAFGLPLLAYLLTLAPGITWAHQGADGGDLITAAVTLGVPHPPGYPTYTLLGWLAAQLPFGSVAWRLNLLSALGTAGAAWLVYKLAAQLTASRPAGLVAGWSLAAAPLVWSQAVITEVYGVNLFFAALLVWLGVQARRGRKNAGPWLGLVFGLALGVHLTALFLLPLLGWLWLAGQRNITNNRLSIFNGQFWRAFFILQFSFFIGLLVFAYLPLRAGRGAVTWGAPGTWPGFWQLVTGQLYGGYLFALPPQALGPRLAALAGYLSKAGPVALTLAGIGLYRGWRIARRAVAWGAVSAGAYAVYALGYTTADSFVFVLPLFLFAGLAAGLGAAEVGRLVSNPARRAMVMAALVAAPVLWGGANAPRLTLRHDAAAETFWRSVLQQAPPGAILLTGDERHTFTLWYARFVLRRRPDVAIIDTRLLAYPWHRADLGRAYPDLTDLDALPGIIQQGRPYRRPLCPVIESEEETRWFVNCLTSKTP